MGMDIFEDYREFEDNAYKLKGKNRRKAYLTYAKKLENLLEENPGSRDLNHLFGYCLYHMLEWYEKDKIRIERAFQRSLMLDPGSYYSLEYLGYFYFDIAQYQLPINSIDTLFGHEGRVHVPATRLFKLEGLRIAGQVRLDSLEGSQLRSELAQLIESKNALDDEDKEHYAIFEDFELEELSSALKESRHAQDRGIMGMLGVLEAPLTSSSVAE